METPSQALRGILFDFDGTLVDSLSDATGIFNEVFQMMNEPQRTPEDIKKYFGTGADRIFLRLMGNEEQARVAFQAYKVQMKQRASRIRLHEGVRELLGLLAAQKIPLGIVTGRHAEDLALGIEPHGIQNQFLTMIADSHIEKSKPDPEGLRLALQKLKLQPHEVMYVGDSTGDIEASRAAGTLSVAALWDPLASREALALAKPDHWAETPADVWKIFTSARAPF